MWNSKWVYRTVKGGSLIKSYRVIVPFYNDFKNFEQFFLELKKIDTSVQFLILDNGSSDNSIGEYLKNNTLKNIKFIKFESNYGYGGGIKKATNYCVEHYIGWMPGNMKIAPVDACNFFKFSIEQEFDLIKAKRVGRPFIDWLKTLVFGILASLHFKQNMLDSGGVPSLTKKAFFKEKESSIPDNFSFDVFMLYYFRSKNQKVLRPKINYTTRLHGESKWQKGYKSELSLIKMIFNSKNSWKK
mgnify:CR=1 FL=1